MMRITGEFCAPRRPSRLAWSLLAMLAAFSALSWGGVAVQSFEARQARAETARLEAVAAERRQRESTATPAPAPWDASARLMLEHANSRWPQVLSALESARAAGVVPTAVNVNVPAYAVTVELQFADYPVLLDYIAQLNASEPSIRWRLVQASADVKNGASVTPGAMPSAARATIAADLRTGP